MNWNLRRAEFPVIFEAGEPICMIVRQRRGELETFAPEIREIGEEPELASAYEQCGESRERFNREELDVPGSEAQKRGWQKDYVRGTTQGAIRAKGRSAPRSIRPSSGL